MDHEVPHRPNWPHPRELTLVSKKVCLELLASVMPRAVWHTATLSPALIGVTAAYLTDPRSTSDAVLILADRLAEAADEAEAKRFVRDRAYLLFLESVAREAAPYLRGGAHQP